MTSAPTEGETAGTESRSDVVIVGGGPGGAALGRLLALQGLDVVLLEATATVPVQYRAELIQPSSAPVLDACGVGEEVRSQARRLQGMEVFGARRRLFHVEYADLGGEAALLSLPIQVTRRLLLDHRRPAGMSVVMGAKVEGILRSEAGGQGEGAVCGVAYTQGGAKRIARSRLVVAADGRHSTVRRLAGIPAEQKQYSTQIITMNGTGGTEDITHVRLHVHSGAFMALAPSTGDEIRIGWAIPTGTLAEMRQGPIDALREILAGHESYVEPWANQLQSWRDVHLQPLNTVIAERWAQDGLLLVGDAAHAVSPFGGQGLNMALHDALIATPIIVKALAGGQIAGGDQLGQLQALREATCRTMLKGGDLALTIFGPGFPQFVREVVGTFAGIVGIPRRVTLPNLALGPRPLRQQLSAATTTLAGSDPADGTDRTPVPTLATTGAGHRRNP